MGGHHAVPRAEHATRPLGAHVREDGERVVDGEEARRAGNRERGADARQRLVRVREDSAPKLWHPAVLLKDEVNGRGKRECSDVQLAKPELGERGEKSGLRHAGARLRRRRHRHGWLCRSGRRVALARRERLELTHVKAREASVVQARVQRLHQPEDVNDRQFRAAARHVEETEDFFGQEQPPQGLDSGDMACNR